MTQKMVLLIAMPTQGHVATPTFKCLIGLTQALARKRITFAVETYDFSDIVFSRNQLMSIFHTRTQFTHLLMMDSDMVVEPAAIWRLMDMDVDFAATAYPQKHPHWRRLRALIEAEATLPDDQKSSMADLLSRNWVYNHQLASFGGGPWVPKRRSGFITVPATGTGLMLLSRAVPETMIAKGVALRKQRLEQVPLHKGLSYHDYFSHLSSADGGMMYGEDQSFCMRWTHQCGGDIWLDTETVVSHYGTKAFVGRYHDSLSRDFPGIMDDEET